MNNNLRNPKLFWQQIRKINSKNRPKISIPLARWVDHFRDIFQADEPVEAISTDDLEVDNLDDLTSTLNGEITQEEILCALGHLKMGKAAGPDEILGEMLVICEHFTTLFE